MASENVVASVIIPMRDAANYVASTLESILQETSIPIEVIVVDDGSTDNSADIVRRVSDERVRVLPGPCCGIPAALNVGFEAAAGEIFMRCDADDLYYAGRIARQVQWLDRERDFGAVCGNYSVIDSCGRLAVHHKCGQEQVEITRELQQGSVRTHLNTFAFRAEVFEKLAGFRSYFHGTEDIDFQLRLAEHFRVCYLPEYFFYYRIHDTSICRQTSKKRQRFLEETARKFQRQRQQHGLDDLERGCPPEIPQFQGKSFVLGTANENLQRFLIGEAWREHRQKNKLKALKLGLRSLWIRPSGLIAWKSLVALFLK